ncbi:LLM class flavin-dependent oxidoreductase [Paractinoplanes durhamensis]|uniref:LLM class flavin-dependent oxidoreductase n=1 Tax=Paractinoplanes durhamensis TaxID=113563 RepID=UPI0019412084|nr:LLM class flavin-dependent oxidoreductase [Actinoplanes durhamensis]
MEIDGAGAKPEAAARAAEAAGFALVTLADSPLPPPGGGSRVEAGVRAAFLARRTSRIGLAPTLHVTVTEPFHLATQLASLDHASLGRAGWVIGADNSAAALATIGGRPLTADGLRREVADVVDVARKLWDSWEDDAVIRDTGTGRFLDADRVHHVNYSGARFSITGPLITPRPPQGQVVVLGADTLGITGRLDVALVAAPALDEIADRAHQARTDGAPLVFAELDLSLGEDRPAGAEQPAGTDRSGGLDAVTSWGAPERLRYAGGEDGLRGLLDRLGGIVDGVRVHPTELDVDLPRLIAVTGPAPAGGPTLRETLGLARPVNQFATAR